MDRIRVAIVGAGDIAREKHLPAVIALADDVELVAAVDVELERARSLAANLAAYDDVETMLREVAPDLVLVCTPPGTHRPVVAACLTAGAWVWCEKPPTLSLAEYDELVALETDGGPYVSYVFQHRFGSGAARLRARLAELGPCRVAVCHTLWFRDDDYYAAPWRGRFATEGGGPTMGHGIHQLDLMLHLLGDWAEVQAMTGTLARRVETEDLSLAMVRLADGGLVSVVNSVLSPRQTSYLRFDFDGTTVELEHLYGYDDSHWRWTPAIDLDKLDQREALGQRGAGVPSSHEAQLRALVASYRIRERPAASGADGCRVLELIAALYASARLGRAVKRGELTPDHPFHHAMNGSPIDA